MAKSTVFAIKGDTSDLDAKLKGLKASAEATFTALETSTRKAQKAQDTLDKSTKSFSITLRKTKSEIEKLNAEKKKNGSLSDEQAKRLTNLEARLKRQTSSYKTATKALKAKVIATKRLMSTQKASLSSYDNLTRRVNKSTISNIKHTNSLRKENAERRALGTAMVRHIRRLESLAVAYFAVTAAYRTTLGAGVELNRQYESMELGLAALTAAKTDAVDATGKEVDSLTKFIAAQQQTKDVLSDIRREATKTPATFAQMVGFYQQAIGHALAASQATGAFGQTIAEVSANTITLTKRMSSLGSSVGMSMDLLNEEIRSLMSGDVSRDSKLALILFGSPTKANAAILEAKKSVNGLRDLFNKALIPFEVLENIETFDKTLNKLVAEIQIVQMAASKPIFDDFSESFKNMAKLLQDEGDDISETFVDIYTSAKVSFESITPSLQQLSTALGNFLTTLSTSASTSLSKITEEFSLWQSTLLGVNVSLITITKSLDNVLALRHIIGINPAATIYNMFNGTGLKKANEEINDVDSFVDAYIEAYERLNNFEKNKRASRSGVLFSQIGLNRDGSIENVENTVKSIDELYDYLTITHEEGSESAIHIAKAREAALIRISNEFMVSGIALRLKKADADDNVNKKELRALAKFAAKKLEIQESQELTGLGGESKEQVVLHQRYQRDLVAYKDHANAKLILQERYEADSAIISEKYRVAQFKKDEEVRERALKKKNSQSRKEFEANQQLRKLSIGLISDEREQKLALAELNHQDRLEEIEYRSELDGWTKEYYTERVRLENAAHEKLLDGYSVTGTIMRNATDSMTNGLEDFFNIASEGFRNFGNLAHGVLNQILKDMIKMQLAQPMSNMILGGFGGSGEYSSLFASGTSVSAGFAKGGSFTGSSSLSAHSNTVVSNPTPFMFASGGVPNFNLGIMGEAGSEAIMPLTRTSNGDLGVKSIGSNIPTIIVNIENNTGGEVEQETTQTSFDGEKFIVSTVLSAINRNQMGARDIIKGVK